MSELKFIFKNILILLILLIGGIGVQTCSNDHPAIDFDTPWLDVSAESSSSAEALSSSSVALSSSSSEQARLQKDKVTGFLQKGPFLKSATVTLYELSSDLAQTGRSFLGTITDDRGGFEISGIELVSPYVLLNVHGFYLNEVSGNESATQITLNSIADVKEKNNANANILTHLEYERVLSLAQGGKSIAEAKKQAQGEILRAFGIEENLAGSDDMSIFGGSESSAILLAVSVLLQGDLSEAMFSVLLTEFNQGIKTNGAWNNELRQARIADWASGADLGAIRKNIENWDLSADVPDFERFVRGFWVGSYGLGVCGSSNEGHRTENANLLSSKKEQEYVCAGGIWREYVPPSSSSSLALSSSSSEPSSSSAELSSSSVEPSSSSGPLCGTAHYNPATHFCYSGDSKPYEFCGVDKKEYSPATQQCVGGVVRTECGSGWFNAETQFCQGGITVLPLCGDGKSTYTANQFCAAEDGKVYDSCNGNTYNPLQQGCCNNATYSLATHSCHGNQTYSCGNLPYNPATHSCHGNQTYSCGNLPYNPATHSCHGNQTYSCGNLPYNPATEFCSRGNVERIVSRCGGSAYNGKTQFCHGSTVVDKCGGTVEYNPSTERCCGGGKYTLATEFCSSGAVFAKCGGIVEHNPSTERCCGGGKYTVATHFCSRGTAEQIVPRCGGSAYNGKTQFCHGSTVVDKCGGTVEYVPGTEACCGTGRYTVATEFCSSNVVYAKCNGNEYNPATQFCGGNNVFAKCGGEKYNPVTEQCCGSGKFTTATQFCFNGSKVGDKCGTRTEVFDPDLYECRFGSKIYLRTPVSYGGDSYDAVLIGAQTWLARNLNFNTSNSDFDLSSICLGYSPSNCATYGRLYYWATALTVCPSGWHLPSDAEWDVLITAAGGASVAGKRLKAVDTWTYDATHVGTDDFGFSALPGGSSINFTTHNSGFWWSATENSANYARYLYMRRNFSNVDKSIAEKAREQLSVRCVKDVH